MFVKYKLFAICECEFVNNEISVKYIKVCSRIPHRTVSLFPIAASTNTDFFSLLLCIMSHCCDLNLARMNYDLFKCPIIRLPK